MYPSLSFIVCSFSNCRKLGGVSKRRFIWVYHIRREQFGYEGGADIGSCRLVKLLGPQRRQLRCRIRLFGGPPIRQECFCALSCPNYIRAGVLSGLLLVALLLLYIVSHHVGQELLRMHIRMILGTLFRYLSHAYQCNMSAILAVIAS